MSKIQGKQIADKTIQQINLSDEIQLSKWDNNASGAIISLTSPPTNPLDDYYTNHVTIRDTSVKSLNPIVVEITVPDNKRIKSVIVEYDFDARGWAWINEQVSYVQCVSDGGIEESGLTFGPPISDSGTTHYMRDITYIAPQNTPLNGVLIFELHAFNKYTNDPVNPNIILKNSLIYTIEYIDDSIDNPLLIKPKEDKLIRVQDIELLPQSDYLQKDPLALDYIRNKPTLKPSKWLYGEEIIYGYHYNWYCLTDIRNITSSDDWRVPSDADYQTRLKQYLVNTYPDIGHDTMAHHLKSNRYDTKEHPYWEDSSYGIPRGIDTFNFNGLPNGYISNIVDSGLLINSSFGCTGVYGGVYMVIHRLDSYNIDRFHRSQNTLRKENHAGIRLTRYANSEELLLPDGTYCDTYVGNNGRKYKTVKIGTLIWTTQNLVETKYRNGDDILILPYNTWPNNSIEPTLRIYEGRYEYVLSNPSWSDYILPDSNDNNYRKVEGKHISLPSDEYTGNLDITISDVEKLAKVVDELNFNTDISIESSIRASVDDSLESALIQEISDRISGDTSLENELSTEISDRISGDTSLETEILVESSIRASVDTSLENAIFELSGATLDIETILGDGELLGIVGGELTGITNIQTQLSTNISSEISERISSDNSLESAISAIDVTSDISVESSIRASVDSILSTTISSEISIRESEALTYLKLSGGTMIGYIKTPLVPVDDEDLTNKAYVDSVAQGLKVRDKVVVATTENLIVTTDGFQSGKTLTNDSAYETLIIDGVTLNINDRVLVKDQINEIDNGIYTVTETGDTLTNWILTRTGEYDDSPSTELMGGDYFFVQLGTINTATGWVLKSTTGNTDPIVDEDDLIFIQFSSAGSYQAGDALELDGTEFNVKYDNDTIILNTSLELEVNPSLIEQISTNISNISELSGITDNIQSQLNDLDSSLTTAISTETSDREFSDASLETVISTLSGHTGIIGPAEDGDYTDGIFTDFTETTPIGTAIDRFNEMFLLLAPTPPSTNWTTAFGDIAPTLTTTSLSNTPRMIGTSTPTSNVLTTQTPSFTLSSNVGTGANARTKEGTFIFTLKDWNDSNIETITIDTNSVSKTNGFLRYTITDPYLGVSGQEGFWVGVTSFTSPTFQVQTIIPRGTTSRQLSFEHPDTQTKNSVTFYIDEPTHTPSVNSLTIGTLPNMTKYISGVPSLNGGETIPISSFNINNVSTYFYSNTGAYNITGTGVVTANSQPFDTIPSTLNENQSFTNKSATVVSTSFYSESLSVTITPRNRISGNGSAQTKTFNNSTDGYLRIDRVSNETLRYTSGSGLYPTIGSTYDNTQSAVSLTTNTELQLLNGYYRWPQSNYTNFDGPNYSSITTGDNISGIEWRWATFALNNITVPVNNITIKFPTGTPSTNIGSNYSDIKMYVKIGSSGWVDATLPQSVQDPYNDGDGALTVAGSTIINRIVTFGTIARSGQVYVRIGIKSSNTNYVFRRPTM